jgi:hypothetical protein
MNPKGKMKFQNKYSVSYSKNLKDLFGKDKFRMSSSEDLMDLQQSKYPIWLSEGIEFFSKTIPGSIIFILKKCAKR